MATPSVEPQFRVAHSMHSAAILQIRASPDGRRILSVSADKTLRIWRTADLRPLRTVFLPSEPGMEGSPSSLAVTPDGKRVYVAGWTGFDWSRASHIYVVDVERGSITGTLGRFENDTVVSLDMSADGGKLAVGLGVGGLRVLDVVSGAVLQADKAYAGDVTFVNYSRDGRLATTSTDGCVRVYDRSLDLLFRNEYPPRPDPSSQCRGSRLGGVRFSPDGRLLAFGVRDLPETVVMDATALRVLRVIKVADAAQQSLCCIAWSTDGATLYLNGNVATAEPTRVYRVSNPLSGSPERWNVGRHTITNMLTLTDGSLVLSTSTPALLKISSNGQPALGSDGSPIEAIAPQMTFEFDWQDLRASPDGAEVSIPLGKGDQARLRFNLKALGVATIVQPETSMHAGMDPPSRSGRVVVRTQFGYLGSKLPTLVNGNAVAMDPEEAVFSWAQHPDRALVVLGTQWRVRLTDGNGRPLWAAPPYLPAIAIHVTISRDARFVIAALGDGTIRWYSIDTGKELLGLFLDAKGSEWVAWRGDGYYASSPNGDQYVGWLVNRDERRSPDFFRAVQFERTLYRPDLVRTALRDPSAVGRLGEQLAQTLKQVAAPRVTIESIRPGSEPDTLAIRFTAEATGRQINEVGVYIDGLPVLRAADRTVIGADAQRLSRTVIARVSSAAAAVRVEAETDVSLGIDESMPLVPPRAAQPRPGKLWVLAAGVSRFDNLPNVRKLPYTTNDARELGAALAAQKGRAFSDVSVVVLTEEQTEKPDKATLLARLRELQQVQPQDTVLVFLASHGTTDSSEYYFVTKNAEVADVEKVLDAEARGTRLADGQAPSLLTGSELANALRRVPGRRILMLDTCHSGAAGGSSDPYALVKRSAAAQVAVVSAARGDESSYESPNSPHGAFTIAIIDALLGKADLPGGPVTLRAAFDAATPKVQAAVLQLQSITRDVKQKASIRQTPVLSAQPVLESSVLAVH